ncbi:MAG: glycosyltransferase family 39 protein [Pyrinomonadaceae bacterium]|nr:glycosyltransferase family 39 protein [Pyrinomonadaceae bacterium]
MNKGLVFLAFMSVLLIGVLFFPIGAAAIIWGGILAIMIVWILRVRARSPEAANFLTNAFIAALLVRVFLAILIYGGDLQEKFGPDALTYDAWGKVVSDYWWGMGANPGVDLYRSGWGMPYIVAVTYFFIGQNPLALQMINCVLGAATMVMAYFTSKEIFNNTRVAQYTAISVGFFPAMVIWTSQLLKEGFIIFFLVLALYSAINLQKKFSYNWVIYLLISLLFLSGLRFYVFFMVVIAIFGGFVLSVQASVQGLASRFIACVLVAVVLAYLGIWRMSADQLDKFGSLERIQISRDWAARAGKSGLDKDVDVSTSDGAISALPIGFLTLMLAPFPWQVSSLSQGLTMPEMIIWWLSIPFMIIGLVFTIKTRFRETIGILFFVLILSITYSLYQGNLGTLYRQRAQIQVFLLLFTAAGVALVVEKRENTKLILKAQRMSRRLPVR